jgi:hypothetical protein
MLPFHYFSDLFAQLGLPDDDASIAQFIRTHSPLDPAVRLENAGFWTQGQADLLREELLRNADWAEVVDQLSLSLRPPTSESPVLDCIC